MRSGSTNFVIVLPGILTLRGLMLAILLLISAAVASAQSGAARVTGSVLDPAGRPLPAARIEFDSAAGMRTSGATGSDGGFTLALPAWGVYTLQVEAVGFANIARKIAVSAATPSLTLRLERLAETAEEVIVTGDASDVSVTSPDPSEKVLVREELLDANPGRPGAPVSIPGLPIETASGGIKAPQYFVPGVAGDHGEPIAQYIAVGGYLVSNNLSANAHGNGYADPNILIAGALGSVATDGGAFNVLEGNHALNLAATYNLNPAQKRFLTLTGDGRDADLAVGFAPAAATKQEWIGVEANYGNGLMKTLEHREQFKWNALRAWAPSNHQITLLSIGYWGISHEGNLVPLGLGAQLNDTIDPRQKDQTHTSILAADDRWKLGSSDEVSFSGFMRTYNLALFSNFGEGLIRQSEFRTVEGAEIREAHTLQTGLNSTRAEVMAGFAYNEDDIHRDNLDHYLSDDPNNYGPFLKVLSNNVTLRDLAPYAAVHGDLGRHLRIYAGLRPELIEVKSADRMNAANSFDSWKTFLSPKATIAWTPGNGPIGLASAAHWLPSASFSIGQAFFTQDPRISVAANAGQGATSQASPFERSHSEQLVIEKALAATDVRLTLGRTTTTATMAKIDPDNGTAEDLGPGKLNFFSASVRHLFSFGTAQAVFSKADARLLGTLISPGMVTPEAPRTIFDGLTTLDKLPMHFHARAEYEYVGHKLLDVGGFEAIPVGETRMAIVRPFFNSRLEVGANGMLARGYTGQTTETFAPGWQLGNPLPPACAAGSGPSGLPNDFDCGTDERAVGIRMVSWIGGSLSWRFGAER